jgi:addiction module HigA family antidote
MLAWSHGRILSSAIAGRRWERMPRTRWLLNSLGAEIVHPGEVLRRLYMEPFGVSQNALARRLGVPPRMVNQIVNGDRAITARTALLLAQVYGGDGMDWLERQALWDLHQARRAMGRRKRRAPAERRRGHAVELERRNRSARLQAQGANAREFAQWQARMRLWIEGGRVGEPPLPFQ